MAVMEKSVNNTYKTRMFEMFFDNKDEDEKDEHP